ncbi:helix-turn-helix domain-containing protein [Brucella sp. IR073]|uniref:helix-turn-helix domain-containing protein n=1 Tax=unclassified Brucella TaxID=2632610 RepID=UPI003B9876B9
MFAVSAIHTNRAAAAVIAKRKAEEKRAKIEREAKIARMKQHIAESERVKEAREEEAKQKAEERYRQIIAAFHEVELGRPAKRLPIRTILSAAIQGTPFTYEDIIGSRRAHTLVDARHYAILCVWALRPDLSLPQIAERVGGRDHTTILHAKNRFGFESRSQAAAFIRAHGREATMARLRKRAA